MEDIYLAHINPFEFRQALGHFASGVTVITTVSEGDVHGMTANAFTSVSLEPPLVLVSVNNHAHMHEWLSQSKRYAVNILSEDQEVLARHFAGHSQKNLKLQFLWKYELPLLEGALVHLACRVVDIHPAGDHTLYIGQVEEFDYQKGAPLLFYTSEYYHLEVQNSYLVTRLAS